MSGCMGARYGVVTAWVEALTLIAAIGLKMVSVRVIVHGTLN